MPPYFFFEIRAATYYCGWVHFLRQNLCKSSDENGDGDCYVIGNYVPLKYVLGADLRISLHHSIWYCFSFPHILYFSQNNQFDIQSKNFEKLAARKIKSIAWWNILHKGGRQGGEKGCKVNWERAIETELWELACARERSDLEREALSF